MASRIEDYALIGNLATVALVGRDGSVDWMGMPRFDSPACFAALLGTTEHGRWLLAPTEAAAEVGRSYRGDTLILETTFTTATGAVCVTDFMVRGEGASHLVRLVHGLRGTVDMHTELVVRFEYGSIVPWVQCLDDGRLHFTAGPDRLVLDTTVRLRGEDMRSVGSFSVAAGEEVAFTLGWSKSYRAVPPPLDTRAAFADVEARWTHWAGSIKPATPSADGSVSGGPSAPAPAPASTSTSTSASTSASASAAASAVRRSLLTLKALTHWETGGIVAAATTSLPEQIGGPRNWDYRYCWLRDATFTLYALVSNGFVDEAHAWRAWLARALAGSTADLQIMYCVAGERRLDERELSFLAGYEGSAPVRIGNAAAGQVQLDVYGEVLGAFYVARCAGMADADTNWALECNLLAHLETIWDQPDEGIWEVRGGRRHFTHSKVMAWMAFDRAVRSADEFGLGGPVAHWRSLRDAIHAQVCRQGFDAEQNSFVQSYGRPALDASLLLLPVVGFLPPEDARVRGTLAAIERGLVRDGLVLRYLTDPDPAKDAQPGRPCSDGLPGGEGAFLPCSFWLADNYILQGRTEEAQALFDRLLSYRNDLGLLAEEYDPVAGRQLGNFPQAFSHVALINTANRLQRHLDRKT